MLFPRKINETIKKWLFEKEIIIINGARQVGKTSILLILKEYLIEKGINKHNVFYLNLEEMKVLETLNRETENLLNYRIDDSGKNYFFIDEIQYLDNPSNFLKHIYDKYADKIKIICSGSSSLELKAKFQDSLVGRKVSFLINPLTFEEFLFFKQSELIQYFDKKDLTDDIYNQFEIELEEYLTYGSLPGIVLQKDKELKKVLLEEYINTYINKDIRSIGKLKSISGFNNIVKILSSQIGNLLKISELCNTTALKRREISKYIDLLEYTYVIDRIFSFKSNIRSQITKMPKVYFFDPGVRNAILDNFLPINSRTDNGKLFENFIYLSLKNNFKNKIFFFRTLNKSEIDFIIEFSGKLTLIESKFNRLNRPIDTRIMKSFKNKEPRVNRILVVNLKMNKILDGIEYIDFRMLNMI
jgi:hypothetical protein